MKRNLRIVALLAAFSGITACTDANFLTEAPTASVAPTNFYKTQDDAISALTAAYATFINLQSPLGTADYFGRNMLMLIEYPTEVVTSRLSAGNERSLMGGYNPQFQSNHAYLESTWEAAYFGINRANTVIARVPAIQMDPTRRDQIVAEAKFLRAVHYRFLAGLFGGVPLKLTETQSIDEAPPARSSAADTYAQIEKDLTEAAAVLPTSWPASDFGRATKGAALTLLGKVYLQAAATGAGTAADYQKAEAAFRQVLTLGYTLDPNYGSLFDGSNERSKEIIWSIQNIRATGAGGYYSQWFAPVTNPVLYTPGPQNQFQAERPFYDSYNPSDTRKDQTWLTSFVNNGKTVTWAWTSGIQTSSNYGSTGPVPRKYLDFGAATNGAEAPDVVLLRYADVLLSLAEAIDANSGPTAEALGYVNQVRARSKVPNLASGLSAAAFKDSVFSDRRFEFVVEGHGIFDSRRNWPWAKARVEANMAIISASNKSPFTSSVEKFDGRPISDKWKLYPIPVHACELNPALTQNPGWEDGICKNPGS
jgi:hypothetical protein